VSGSPRALSAGTDFDIGWFARNEWYRNVYYAVAAPNLPGALPSVSGCSSTNCLSINDPATQNIRALLILAGRRLDTQTRPNATLSNYLEHQNANLDVFYEQRPVRSGKVVDPTLNAPWNDRVVLADWIAPNPTFPLGYLP
jgi:hypothetical protein